MTIVSGTDFSENATQAAYAAAAIAGRLSVPLKLVHVADQRSADLAVPGREEDEPLRERLHNQAKELGARFGIDVEPVVASGSPYEKLIEIACAAKARLIVVSSLGAKSQHRWLLGSVAERVAQTSPLPVLIVRDSTSIEAWALGGRPLRTMVGVEIAASSKAALRWAAELRTLGRCDLLVTQVVWPSEEHRRLGIPSPIPLDSLRPELHELLMRDLREWAGEMPGDGETTFNVSSGWGRVDAHLALLAVEAKADLLVVGTHQRATTARFWQGSVSRGVLHHATCNVVCVPSGEAAEDQDVIPVFRSVLIPTDFSSLANRAIPFGYGLVNPFGVVYLLHVITERPSGNDADPAQRLRALIPQGAAAKGVLTQLEVIQEGDAWMGIWHAAGRLGVDAICMATHGRSGVSRLVLGSQAQEVVQRARQPIFLVPFGGDA